MSLKYGVVGLPNVGKSTLFNALTNGNAVAANFPFCTIEPNIGIVPVNDSRLEVLASIANPNKTVPTYVEFVDIAGLVAGASKGEGLGNKFLANIREVDAIVHVVRCFENDEIQHVSGKVDPVFDKEIIDYELQLKDLETIAKRIAKAEKSSKSGDKATKQELEILLSLEKGLSEGINARNVDIEECHKNLVNSWQLLTTKPVIYVANIDEATLAQGINPFLEKLRDLVSKEGAEVVPVCVALEEQLARIEVKDREIFLNEYNLEKSALDVLVYRSYITLGLITYFTVGVQEVRAWTIKNGFKAPQAAGVIHSDFEKGFIKAEVIRYSDFVHYRSEIACKDAGKLSIEGKNYVVSDGDIMHFRFNV